jgi:hypothetical protein
VATSWPPCGRGVNVVVEAGSAHAHLTDSWRFSVYGFGTRKMVRLNVYASNYMSIMLFEKLLVHIIFPFYHGML